jgi:hypothetical protein
MRKPQLDRYHEHAYFDSVRLDRYALLSGDDGVVNPSLIEIATEAMKRTGREVSIKILPRKQAQPSRIVVEIRANSNLPVTGYYFWAWLSLLR